MTMLFFNCTTMLGLPLSLNTRNNRACIDAQPSVMRCREEITKKKQAIFKYLKATVLACVFCAWPVCFVLDQCVLCLASVFCAWPVCFVLGQCVSCLASVFRAWTAAWSAQRDQFDHTLSSLELRSGYTKKITMNTAKYDNTMSKTFPRRCPCL